MRALACLLLLTAACASAVEPLPGDSGAAVLDAGTSPVADAETAPDATAQPDAGAAQPDAAPADARIVDPPDAGLAPDATTDAGLDLYFPPADGEWATLDPAASGWDPAALEAAVTYAGDHATRALVITQGGRILAERYWNADASFERDIASAQKSIVAVLTGIAVDEGRVALEDPVSTHLGMGWTFQIPAEEQQIQVRHLLTMTSGLDPDFRRAAAPGTTWLYDTDAYQQVRRMLEATYATDIGALSTAKLFAPIGARSANWVERRLMRDPHGNPLLGLELTARDLARFGVLVLARGRWADTRVVNEAFLTQALTSSQPLNPAYGLLWWLNGQSFALLPPRARVEGTLIPHGPADLVAALGAEDQKLYVSASERLVVTRLGASAGPRAGALSSFDDELWTRIMAAKR
jgi:CubicO group peptidase (beta-lactamase class C family)